MLREYDTLKRYRLFAGYTQKSFAAKLDMKLVTYQSKEQGRIGFSDFEKMKVKKIISQYIPDITIDDIFFSPLVQRKYI